MNPAPSEEERFADWVDGRLDAGELARLELDLERDPEMRRRAVRYRATVELVRRSADTERAPDDFADAVLERLPARRLGAGPRSLPPAVWRAIVPSAAVAAVLGAFLLTLWYLPPRAPGERTTASAPETTGDAKLRMPVERVDETRQVARDQKTDELLDRDESARAPASTDEDENTTTLGSPETFLGGVKAAEPAQPEGERLGLEAARKIEPAPAPEVSALTKEVAPTAGGEQDAPASEALDQETPKLKIAATRSEPPAAADDSRSKRADEQAATPPFRLGQPDTGNVETQAPATGNEKAQKSELEETKDKQREIAPAPAAKPPPSEPWRGHEEFGAKLVVVALPQQEDRRPTGATRGAGTGGAAPLPEWITSGDGAGAPAIEELAVPISPAAQSALASGFELQPGDRLFAATGSPAQLATYFIELGTSVQKRGGKTDLLRTTPGSALSNAATQQMERVAAKKAPAAQSSLDTVLIVWRATPAPEKK